MWKTIGPDELQLGSSFIDWLYEVTANRAHDWLPTDLDIAKSPPFARFGRSEDDIQTLLGIMLWIRTARAAGYGYGAKNWLPSRSDLTKSALFERIRSGAQPLPEPPPLGMACPWYAVVEDPGPHYVFDTHFYGPGDVTGDWERENDVVIFQNVYVICNRISDTRFIVRERRNETSYRFRLWFDPDWQHPSKHPSIPLGGWFLQNTAFENAEWN